MSISSDSLYFAANVTVFSNVHSWYVAYFYSHTGQRGISPLNFSLSENFILVKNFSFKYTKLGLLEISILGQFAGKLEILSTHI